MRKEACGLCLQVRSVPEDTDTAQALRLVAEDLRGQNVAVLTADLVCTVPLQVSLSVSSPQRWGSLLCPMLKCFLCVAAVRCLVWTYVYASSQDLSMLSVEQMGYDAQEIECLVVLWLGFLVHSRAQAQAKCIDQVSTPGTFCGSSTLGRTACAGGLCGALCAGQRMHGAAGAAPHLAGIRDQARKGAQERRLCRCGRAVSLPVPPKMARPCFASK